MAFYKTCHSFSISFYFKAFKRNTPYANQAIRKALKGCLKTLKGRWGFMLLQRQLFSLVSCQTLGSLLQIDEILLDLYYIFAILARKFGTNSGKITIRVIGQFNRIRLSFIYYVDRVFDLLLLFHLYHSTGTMHKIFMFEFVVCLRISKKLVIDFIQYQFCIN